MVKPRQLESLVNEATAWGSTGSTQWWRLELRSFDAAPAQRRPRAVAMGAIRRVALVEARSASCPSSVEGSEP